MVMAGFAGNPHMIACTILALTKLVHNHRGIVTVVHCFIVSLHPVKLPALSVYLENSARCTNMFTKCDSSSSSSQLSFRLSGIAFIFICPIAIAYSMGQIIKSVCVCQSLSVSVCLRALSQSHFLIDFHQNWHRRTNSRNEERIH